MTDRQIFECQNCTRSTLANEINARASGWRIWQGKTQSGTDAVVRICPVCTGDVAAAAEQSWQVGCHTCDWEWEDEYGEGPLTKKQANEMADDHECERETWVKPPPAAEAPSVLPPSGPLQREALL
jgi:hypothetical protein